MHAKCYVHICRHMQTFPNRKEETTFGVYLRMKVSSLKNIITCSSARHFPMVRMPLPQVRAGAVVRQGGYCADNLFRVGITPALQHCIFSHFSCNLPSTAGAIISHGLSLLSSSHPFASHRFLVPPPRVTAAYATWLGIHPCGSFLIAADPTPSQELKKAFTMCSRTCFLFETN